MWQPELTLYHMAPSRSSIVRWMLEELGQDYDLHLLDGEKEEQRQPALPRDQPDGQGAGFKARPSRDHGNGGDLLLPGRCVPRKRSSLPFRATLVEALTSNGCSSGPVASNLPSSIACSSARMCRVGALGWGDLDTVLNIIVRAVDPGPFLLGDHFTAADIIIGFRRSLGLHHEPHPRAGRTQGLSGAARGAARLGAGDATRPRARGAEADLIECPAALCIEVGCESG